MDRRRFMVAAAMAAVGVNGTNVRAQSGRGVRLVIAGAGAAGLSLAARFSKALGQARITIIDSRKLHIFQPGLTLVGAGLWPAEQVIDDNKLYVPNNVEWVQEAVAEFNPDSNQVVTETGRRIPYDFLFVATGLTLDYAAIEGLDTTLIGQKGLASVYAGPREAAASAVAIDTFIEQGGVGLFGRPSTEMKCAGAPLKMTFITDDKARLKGRRSAVKLIYNAHNNGVFAVAPVNEKVSSLFQQRDIHVNYNHVLQAIDVDRKVAQFGTPGGPVTLDYNFIHVVPPMRAPHAVRQSPLAWQSGVLSADGWVEADKASLRHPRYSNVFSVGDVAGVPRGKTAASVKWQVPVVVDHVLAELAGKTSTLSYNGYTSCPLITRYGKAMLIEFDYDGKLVPSFPFIEPLDELWVSWLIDEKILHGTYRAMLLGHA